MNKEVLEIYQSKKKSLIIQLKRSFIITKKDLKIYYNKPPVLIQGIIFPIILFIALTIGRNIQPLYLISGLMTMTLFLTSTSIGPIVFPWETMRKTFERVITCPVSIKTIILGSVWGSFIYGFLFSLVPLILGIILFSEQLIFNLLLIIIGMLLAGLVFSCFSQILSVPSTDTPGNTMMLTILIKFPLIFISPLFIPINSSSFAIISPLTYFADIINVGLGDVSAFGTFGILIDISFLFIFGFFFLFLAFTLHSKTLERRFQ
ncbi:MAG: ABC transporter permease [Candidatus Lokiarchaeota archaeon]|nr:ABC transporter permease [Candidatus Lokiarchaeota archaeon]